MRPATVPSNPVVSLRSTSGYGLASFQDAARFVPSNPVVSLRSTSGYGLASFQDASGLVP